MEPQGEKHLTAKEFADFVRYATRRFDELSVEINANTQLLDMAQNGIASRFGEVLALLGAINYQGHGASQHNVGIELDAVVQTSEDAANRILHAAEGINSLIAKKTGPSADQEFLDAIAGHTQEILVACAFQDLTGQRIGRTLHNIRRAEAELGETLKRIGLKIDPRPASEEVFKHIAVSQADIDNLFA